MRLPTHRDQYDVTHTLLVSARFWSQVFSFYFKDGISGRHYMVSHILLYIVFMRLICWLIRTLDEVQHIILGTTKPHQQEISHQRFRINFKPKRLH
jgi:hypothetical protein